ncbi:hypothetical protein [Caulobacter sp. DWR2-3-1b2]|uniref:hypothetical protein n=1 Tax=unclassified Caulobacter TaxID=2648921 RepID=UPI003CF3991B
MILLITALAPAVAAAQAEDWHVKLRAQAGLSASSAKGEVRIFNEARLAGGGETSLVARREGKGRWTVSRVMSFLTTEEHHWRLTALEGAALDVALDDPAVLVETPAPTDHYYCLDPPSTQLNIHWRGRAGGISKDCETWGALARAQALLTEGHE